METIFANSGMRIDYKGAEYRIIKSGITKNNIPYVELVPENQELAQRMKDEIRKRGHLVARNRLHEDQKLVLGEDEYLYW